MNIKDRAVILDRIVKLAEHVDVLSAALKKIYSMRYDGCFHEMRDSSIIAKDALQKCNIGLPNEH